MNQQAKSQSDQPAEDLETVRQCPLFIPKRFMRQLAIDDAARWVALVTLLLCVVAAVATEWLALSERSLMVLVIFVAGLWVGISVLSARAAQQLPQISAMLEVDHTTAEAALARTLRRWPMQRSVRLLLYHRLAVLRHRQQRYAEAAAVSQALLAVRLGQAGQVRPHLLLILAESRLAIGDLVGTYQALADLHRARLSLVEVLQLLAVQTRYEIATGQERAALDRIDRKIQLIELMPMPQCGALHAMLAVAAQRCQQTQLADWLRRRAELLCEPDQLQAYLSDRPATVDMA